MTSDRIKVAGVMMSREEAARVEQERQRMFGSGMTFARAISYLFAMLILMFFASVVKDLFASSGRASGVSGSLIPLLVLLLVLGVLYWYDQRAWKRDKFRQLHVAMKRLGIHVCRRCNYDLRGVQDAVCPECGKAFQNDV
ncbi:MAG: hypothetical protein KDA16_07965 [Phycisphaerales bacterium]|nr:hypothetical protein [Phycisphaerales bacterium]